MIKPISFAILLLGLVLLAFGLIEMNSRTSEISRMMIGIPTDRAIWLTAIGALLATLGVASMIQVSSRRRVSSAKPTDAK